MSNVGSRLGGLLIMVIGPVWVTEQLYLSGLSGFVPGVGEVFCWLVRVCFSVGVFDAFRVDGLTVGAPIAYDLWRSDPARSGACRYGGNEDRYASPAGAYGSPPRSMRLTVRAKSPGRTLA